MESTVRLLVNHWRALRTHQGSSVNNDQKPTRDFIPFLAIWSPSRMIGTPLIDLAVWYAPLKKGKNRPAVSIKTKMADCLTDKLFILLIISMIQ